MSDDTTREPGTRPRAKTVVESRVVSAPGARVLEMVSVLSEEAAKNLETRGEIPSRGSRAAGPR